MCYIRVTASCNYCQLYCKNHECSITENFIWQEIDPQANNISGKWSTHIYHFFCENIGRHLKCMLVTPRSCSELSRLTEAITEFTPACPD